MPERPMLPDPMSDEGLKSLVRNDRFSLTDPNSGESSRKELE